MRHFVIPLLAGLAFAGCSPSAPPGWQGYIEGEYVYVAAPLAGRVETIAVQKGDRVKAAAPLFTLDSTAELAAQSQSKQRLEEAEAQLADLRKGERPSELAALEARLGQANAAAALSAIELDRATKLHVSGAATDDDFDRAKLAHDGDLQQVKDLQAQLATAQLGARSDAIAAAESAVAADRAALRASDWAVEQKSQAAPGAGLVYDVLFRVGEYAGAGIPVVALLPPENIKVRFFLPEEDFAPLKAGDRVRVTVPGLPSPLEARVSFLSPQPEYTPPVLYNRDNRAKLVFMVEATFAAAAARDLHPGQPVDVAPAK
jgi:HlyD family secretion protein